MKKEITKDMTIEELLNINEDFGEVLMGFDMHCIFCPMGRMETIEEACQVHGVDVDFALKKLNEVQNFSVKGKVKSNQKLKKGTMKKD